MNNILLDDLKLKYPIVQGGMANIATYELAAAVTKAGGLGIIGTGGWNPEMSREEIQKMKDEVGDAPFGVNVMLMNPFASDIIDVCIEMQVPIITTGAGSPGKYVEKIHAAGIKIVPVVPSVGLAKRMEKLGVDAVIAEGGESGGHVGELTTMAFVPQVVEALNIPVIAAGGIANSSQFCAAMSFGVHGVQIGTCLLTTVECPVHDEYKNMILEAKDTSTMVTGRLKGAPVRAIKNSMTREYAALETTDIEMHELEMKTLGSLRKAVYDGNREEGSFMAGQVSGMLNEIKTVEQVITEMADISACVTFLEELNAKISKN